MAESILRKNTELGVSQMSTARELDRIYDELDYAFRSDNFEKINNMLKAIDVEKTNSSILFGYLTASLPAKNDLPYRDRFLREVKRVVEERGENEEGLFQGL